MHCRKMVYNIYQALFILNFTKGYEGLKINGNYFTPQKGQKHQSTSHANSTTVRNARECASKCLTSGNCFSFNMIRQTGGKLQCQLNDPAEPLQLMADPEAAFYGEIFIAFLFFTFLPFQFLGLNLYHYI